MLVVNGQALLGPPLVTLRCRTIFATDFESELYRLIDVDGFHITKQ